MRVFKLSFKYRTIVYVIGFAKKTQNFVYFVPCDCVQISPACGSNTYQIIYVENFRLAVLAFATIARESFTFKFTANIDFRLGILGYHY